MNSFYKRDSKFCLNVHLYSYTLNRGMQKMIQNLFCIRKIAEKQTLTISRRGSIKNISVMLKKRSLIEILVYLLVFYNSVPHPSEYC